MSRQRMDAELHRARAQVKALRRRPKVTGKAEIAISALTAGDGREEIASELEVGSAPFSESRPDIPCRCKLKMRELASTRVLRATGHRLICGEGAGWGNGAGEAPDRCSRLEARVRPHAGVRGILIGKVVCQRTVDACDLAASKLRAIGCKPRP